MQCKHVKILFKSFPPIGRNVSENFVCLCRRMVNPIYTIFNTVHTILDMSNIFKFQNIWRIFTRIRACTDGQTDRQVDRQTDRQTECINNFQLCWNVLKKELLSSNKQNKKWETLRLDASLYVILNALYRDIFLLFL